MKRHFESASKSRAGSNKGDPLNRGHLHFRVMFFIATAVMFPLGISAQTGSNSSSLQPVKVLSKLDLALQGGSAKVSVHDFAGALTAVTVANENAIGTPEWNMETCFALITLAGEYRTKGDSVAVFNLAAMVQQQLATAETLFSSSTPPSEQANEQELRGMIAERYQGDRVSAKMYYARAVALAPGIGRAPALLAALIRTDAELAKKGAQSSAK